MLWAVVAQSLAHEVDRPCANKKLLLFLVLFGLFRGSDSRCPVLLHSNIHPATPPSSGPAVRLRRCRHTSPPCSGARRARARSPLYSSVRPPKRRAASPPPRRRPDTVTSAPLPCGLRPIDGGDDARRASSSSPLNRPPPSCGAPTARVRSRGRRSRRPAGGRRPMRAHRGAPTGRNMDCSKEREDPHSLWAPPGPTCGPGGGRRPSGEGP
eukprot:scaffold3362_cov402-Prasinococcus_capsulatus_cf.AAC.24